MKITTCQFHNCEKKTTCLRYQQNKKIKSSGICPPQEPCQIYEDLRILPEHIQVEYQLDVLA